MRIIVTIAIFYLLISCTSIKVVDFPQPPSMPGAWGSFELEYFKESQCPNLEGTYNDHPEIFRSNLGSPVVTHGESAHISRLFPFHLVESVFLPMGQEPKNSESIVIDQITDSSIELRQWTLDGESIEVSKFEMESDHFHCKKGVLKFPKYQHFGMIEGITLNVQVQVQVRKADDGSLIMIWSRGPYRGAADTAQSKFIFHFYRFTQE